MVGTSALDAIAEGDFVGEGWNDGKDPSLGGAECREVGSELTLGAADEVEVAIEDADLNETAVGVDTDAVGVENLMFGVLGGRRAVLGGFGTNWRV